MHPAEENDRRLLAEYVEGVVREGGGGLDAVRPRDDVTALMYFFWSEENAGSAWPGFEGALLATWKFCGRLKTVVVANRRHECLSDFAGRFPNVEIQTETALVPGDIDSMSVDCNSRLYRRFATDYVLIVQDDGFPLRRGLDEFAGRGYDFIGAPYCRTGFMPDLLTRLLNFCPSNGGFSLRSRKLCRLTAEYWEKLCAGGKFKSPEMSEDVFCTSTLPRRSIRFWLSRRQAPSGVSGRFSYEGTFGATPPELPFGFHTATAFAGLKRKFAL